MSVCLNVVGFQSCHLKVNFGLSLKKTMKLGNNKRIIINEIPDFRDTCTFIYIARLNIVILSAKQSCLETIWGGS